MAEITINKTDLDYATDFIIQYLRDAGFTGSLDEGTGIYDLAIKAYATLYTMFKGDVDRVRAYLSLAEAQRQESDLGTEYDTVIDGILSNWFVSRKLGSKTTGTLRLFFTRELPELIITTTNANFTIGSANFIPDQDYTFAAIDGDFTTVLNTTENTDEYYVEVDVESKINVAEVVIVGDTVTSIVSNVYFKRAEVLVDFTTGENIETSAEFIARTEEVITTRELITNRSIKTVLLEDIANLDNIYVAGYGDPEQARDVVSFDSGAGAVTVHVGNKADLYLHSGYTVSSYGANLLGGIFTLAGVETFAGIISLEEQFNSLVAESGTDDNTVTIAGAFRGAVPGSRIVNTAALGSSLVLSVTSDDEVELATSIVGQTSGDTIELSNDLVPYYPGISDKGVYSLAVISAGSATITIDDYDFGVDTVIQDDTVASGFLLLFDVSGIPYYYTIRYSSWTGSVFTLASDNSITAEGGTDTTTIVATAKFATAQVGDLIRNTTVGEVSQIKEVIDNDTIALTSPITGQVSTDAIELNTMPFSSVTSDTLMAWTDTGEEFFGTYDTALSPYYMIMAAGNSNHEGYVVCYYIEKDSVKDVYNYVVDDRNRVACFQPLPRSTNTVIIDITGTVVLDSTSLRTSTEILADVENSIITYIDSLPTTEMLAVSGIIHTILTTVTEVESVTLPLTLNYSLVDPADMSLKTGSITDIFSIPSMAGIQVTANTLQFYTNTALITITEA